MGPLAQIGLAVGGVLAVIGIIALSLLVNRRQRGADAELIAAVDRCFTTLAERRGLAIERFPPMQHPVVGEIPIPPRLHGKLDRFTVELSLETNPASDGDAQMVLRLGAPAGAADWPSITNPCRRRSAVSLRARGALDRLCSGSHRVELGPRTLIAEPKGVVQTNWGGLTRRVELDAGRLGAWLDLALNVARSL